ncbi:MAG: NADH-quinone oxidoreductase subunit NuoK [Planctomycetes bacterium]|nr:NADH-quinone oxidoreductase subunit NuoK [Planctomycetota bacterium]
MIVLTNYLIVGCILFVLGAIGFLTRRNLITLMLSAEMMLHGVSLNFVAFSNFHQNMQGQTFTAFILTVAACEAGIALALILTLYKRTKSLDVSLWSQLSEADIDSPHEEEPAVPTTPPAQKFPQLTPAGRAPQFQKETVHRV